MDKIKVVRDLLELHCNGCSGKTFNCQGCTREELIREIIFPLDKNIKEIKPKKTTKK